MRILVSFILSLIAFITPFHGSADSNSVKEPGIKIAEHTATSKCPDNSISEDHAIALLSAHRRPASSTQNRFYPLTDLINTSAFQNRHDRFFEEKLFVHPYLYCKRIGMKLLFPEHYFW
jgi:hypothetical protein